MTGAEREAFALLVMEEVRRWPGVEMRPHASADGPGTSDGVEFRLFGRQFGHVHHDCAVHLALTKALRETLVGERLAQPLSAAPATGWVMFNPISIQNAERAIWLLRLNYVRLRRQRLTPDDAAGSELLQKHEAALGSLSSNVARVLRRTQLRSRPRPMPMLEA